MKLQENSSNLLTEKEVRKLMYLFSNDDVNYYLKQRKQYIKAIESFEDDKIKNHYLEVITSVDKTFNDDTDLIEGIKELINSIISKKNEKPFQILSFCMTDGGDEAIVIRTLKHANSDNIKDHGIYYTEELTELHAPVFSEVFGDPYDLEEFDFYVDDFWDQIPKLKNSDQIYRCIKKVITDFDFSKLNIKYPLEVYIDYEDGDDNSGNLITKIDNA